MSFTSLELEIEREELRQKSSFFLKVDEIDQYVCSLEILVQKVLEVDASYLAIHDPSFYSRFLSRIQFRLPINSKLTLRRLASLRGEVIVKDLSRFKIPFEMVDLNTEVSSPGRLRYGILVKDLTINPETRALFGYLPTRNNKSSDIEVYVFCLGMTSDKKFANLLCELNVKVIALPESLFEIISCIRKCNLDLLHFANDSSAKYSISSRLVYYKLAKKASVCVSTIMPVSKSKIDYFYCGRYLKDNSRNDEFDYPLVGEENAGYTFYNSLSPPSLTARKTKKISQADVRFISGSNFWKINGDVVRLWSQILLDVPNSTLRLSVYPPHYSKASIDIERNIIEIVRAVGVNPSRIVFLPTSSSPKDWLAELSNSSIYLDSFPYSSLTSIHDAIEAGIPPVVCRGPLLRNLHAAAILDFLGVPELICDSLSSYIEVSTRLVVDQDFYEDINERLYVNRPRLVDVEHYSGQFTRWVLSASYAR
jgi:predicted O-linked N-acetylglucosamine transferase (SPINDLY family)